jgi:hypothetical protein
VCVAAGSERVVPEGTTVESERFGEPKRRHSLVDHLIGDCEQHWRHVDAERPRRTQVDDELELGRLHDRQVGGLGALEDAAGIDASLTKHVREVGSVAHQPAGCDIIMSRIGRRNPVARRQGDKLNAAADEECVGSNEEAIGALARKVGKGLIDLVARAGLENLICSPMARPVSCTSRNVVSVTAALAGLTSTATRTALGTS